MTGWKGARERPLFSRPSRHGSSSKRQPRPSPQPVHPCCQTWMDGSIGGGGWGSFGRTSRPHPAAPTVTRRFPRGQSCEIGGVQGRARCARGERTSLAGGSVPSFSSSLCFCAFFFVHFTVHAGRPANGGGSVGSRVMGLGVHGSAEKKKTAGRGGEAAAAQSLQCGRVHVHI